ncbi:oligosaccharide flippase family protein [Devosia sp. MC521]|nr:oligosaccharide flippase family protein [Devosia sp. MC521]QMW63295.1 oligosaccharide flippase family protein [Devosia sp. MC521]
MKAALAQGGSVSTKVVKMFGSSALLVILGRVAFLTFFLVAARFSSAAEFGEFATSLALAQILAIPCTLGTAPAAQAILPGAMDRTSSRLRDIFVRYSVTATTFATLIVGLTLFGAAKLNEILGVSANLGAMAIGALWLLPGMAIGTLREFIARSSGQIRLSLLPRDVVWTVACVVAVIIMPAFVDRLIVSCALLLTVVEFISITMLVRRLRCWPMRPAPLRPFRRWRNRSFAMMANNTGGQLLDRFDIFVVGLLFSLEIAGLYSVASRLAPLASLSQRFIIPVQAAKISLAMARRDWHSALGELRIGVVTGLIFAVVVLSIFSFGNQLLLGLYGSHYIAAAPLLLILTLGQTSTAVGSNFGLVVSLGPRNWQLAKIIWLTVLPATIAAYFAGLLFGPFAVAITAASAVFIYNGIIVWAAIETLKNN